MLGLRTLIFDVTDLPAAKRFYADVLGKPPSFDEPFYVGFDVGGYEFGLHPVEKVETSPGNVTGYLAADDVEATLARVIALGAKLKDAPGGTRVTLDHLGWPARGLVEDPQWEETFKYFEPAWLAVLKQLAETK